MFFCIKIYRESEAWRLIKIFNINEKINENEREYRVKKEIYF